LAVGLSIQFEKAIGEYIKYRNTMGRKFAWTKTYKEIKGTIDWEKFGYAL